MRLPERVLRNGFGALVGSLLTVVAGLVFLNPYIGAGLRRISYNLPFACSVRLPTAPEDVVIVALDDDSHRRHQQDYGMPWDPALHARVVERLRGAGARLVVFDILFQEQRSADYTPLASAIRDAGGVVLGSSLRFQSESNEPPRPLLRLPQPMLLSAALGHGAIELLKDPDTTVRRLLPWIPDSHAAGRNEAQTNYPTLAWVAAAAGGAGLEARSNAPPTSWHLNYYGPPGTIEPVPYWRVLSNACDGFFSNRIVFIGERRGVSFTGTAFAPPDTDTFRSPYAGGRRFDGVEVHATACANLMEGRWLREVPMIPTLLAIVLSGVAAGVLLTRWHPLVGLAVAVGSAVAVFAGACALQTGLRLWFPWAIILAVQIPAGLVWGVVFHATKARVQSGVLERSLALYLSPKQVGRLLKHPELLHPGGREQTVSILYSDIANFSKRAERMDAAGLLDWLNQYYARTIACIHEQDGTVLSLIGDAIFALWNAPQEQGDHVARACQAAFLLNQCSLVLDETSSELPLRTRIGLHTGPVCVGNLGSPDRFQYTAIGDAVNLASRLEGLNQRLGTSILASRDFSHQIEPHVVSRSVGQFRFKGFDRVVEVCELLELAPPSDPASAPWRDQFALGLHHFRRRAWGAAEAAFQEVCRLRGTDGPSQFYLGQIRVLQENPPPPDWAGEINLDAK